MQDKLDDWFAEDFGKGDFTSQAVVENSPCKAIIKRSIKTKRFI